MSRNQQQPQYDPAVWITQTALADLFGLTPQQIGKILTSLGLRAGYGPTKLALDLGLVLPASTRHGWPITVWHSSKVRQYIKDRAGSPNSINESL
jgi:hypothetical protein